MQNLRINNQKLICLDIVFLAQFCFYDGIISHLSINFGLSKCSNIESLHHLTQGLFLHPLIWQRSCLEAHHSLCGFSLQVPPSVSFHRLTQPDPVQSVALSVTWVVVKHRLSQPDQLQYLLQGLQFYFVQIHLFSKGIFEGELILKEISSLMSIFVLEWLFPSGVIHISRVGTRNFQMTRAAPFLFLANPKEAQRGWIIF